MTKKKIYIIIFVIMILAMLVIPSYCSASGMLEDLNSFKPNGPDKDDVNIISTKAGGIYQTLIVIGVVVGAITILVIGIKYMVGSVEQKAEYKKTLVPYAIGAMMVFAISNFLNIFYQIATSI